MPSLKPSRSPSFYPSEDPSIRPSLKVSSQPPPCQFVVSDAFSGYDIPVRVTVTTKGPCIEINVNNTGTIGDIRGVFFNLRTNGFNSTNIDYTTIKITTWTDNNGTTIGPAPPFDNIATMFQCNAAGDFPLISPSAQMKGGGAGGDGGREYNCGVEVS